MTAKYYAILTNQGAAKLANATALGTTLRLTQMAIGDANGVLPAPDATQTALINQKRIAPLNSLSIDPDNSSQIIAEQVIPESDGGYWIRELGLYDDEGVLIAVANCPETYKPQMQEGSGRTQTVRMVLIVSSTAAVTLKIDPSVVLATRKYVDDKAIEVRAYVDDKATEARAYADGLLKTHVASANPHNQYLQINQNLKEIANAGSAAVAGVLKNLGLGEGSALPVGIPVPWPTATAPEGWLKCNGAAFSAAQYPKLAQVYPALMLPDLRGTFIRGWDDGRGLDPSRNLLSFAYDTLRKHTHSLLFGNGEGYNTPAVHEKFRQSASSVYFAISGSSGIYISEEGGNETAPCNVAFNYIVRAA